MGWFGLDLYSLKHCNFPESIRMGDVAEDVLVHLRDGRSHRTEDLWTALSRLGEDAQYQDCTLVCGDGRLAGARLLLALAVPHVGRLLGGEGGLEEQGTMLLLPDFSVTEIKECINTLTEVKFKHEIKEEIVQVIDPYDGWDFSEEKQQYSNLMQQSSSGDGDNDLYDFKETIKEQTVLNMFANKSSEENENTSFSSSFSSDEHNLALKSKRKKIRTLKACAECGMEVTDLPRHMERKHSTVKWLPCGDPCTHRSRRLHDLKQHQKKGSCRKNQVLCNSCGEWLSSESAKESHRSRFRCPSQYACMICTSTFRTEKEIRKHMADDHDTIS